MPVAAPAVAVPTKQERSRRAAGEDDDAEEENDKGKRDDDEENDKGKRDDTDDHDHEEGKHGGGGSDHDADEEGG